MNHDEFVEKWTAFMRANPEKQHKGSLRENDRMCCLGAGLECVGIPGKPMLPNGAGPIPYGYEGSFSLPSFEQAEKMGLSTHVGEFYVNSLPDHLRDRLGSEFSSKASLAGLNDSGIFGWDFIADVIEARPKGLFGKTVDYLPPEEEYETATP